MARVKCAFSHTSQTDVINIIGITDLIRRRELTVGKKITPEWRAAGEALTPHGGTHRLEGACPHL